MRRRELSLALLAGLCCAALAGCANNGWMQYTRFDPASQTGFSPVGRNAWGAAASGSSRKRTLESEFAMARLFERRGEDEQAEELYMASLQKAPRDARIHHRLGVLAVKRADFARAEQQLLAARSLAPPTAELLSDIGYCYYLQQRLPEAEQTLNEALKLEPAYAAAANNLALVMGRQGRLKESLNLFKQATNNEAEAYANLAYVMAQNGDSEQAKQTYLRALTLNNTLRAAAQAALQVDEHARAQARFAAANRRPVPAATPNRIPRQTAAPEAVVVLSPPPNREPEPWSEPTAAQQNTVMAANAGTPFAPPASQPDPAVVHAGAVLEVFDPSSQSAAAETKAPAAEVVVESHPALDEALSQAARMLNDADRPAPPQGDLGAAPGQTGAVLEVVDVGLRPAGAEVALRPSEDGSTNSRPSPDQPPVGAGSGAGGADVESKDSNSSQSWSPVHASPTDPGAPPEAEGTAAGDSRTPDEAPSAEASAESYPGPEEASPQEP